MNDKLFNSLAACLELEQIIGEVTTPGVCRDGDQSILDLLSHLEDEYGEFMINPDVGFDFNRWNITVNTLCQVYKHNPVYYQVFGKLHIALSKCYLCSIHSSISFASGTAKNA